jgi:hypothetical protein
MSGLGRVPSFEPDEETKALIESMFEQKQEVKKEAKLGEEYQSLDEMREEDGVVEEVKRHRVRIPEPPAQTKKEQEISMHLAKEELDIIHDAFMEFSEKVSDTVIYGHLYNEVLKLTEAFQDMEAIVNDDIDKEELTKYGLGDYEKMRSIRARVLHDVYNHYKEDK